MNVKQLNVWQFSKVRIFIALSSFLAISGLVIGQTVDIAKAEFVEDECAMIAVSDGDGASISRAYSKLLWNRSL